MVAIVPLMNEKILILLIFNILYRTFKKHLALMKLFNAALFIIFSLYHVQAQVKYLHCGHLIDGQSKSVQSSKTIIVKANKIIDIRDGYATVPDTAELVDLTDQYVMPGFIDMHVHIEGQSSPQRYSESFSMNKADVALRATMYCERTLMAGFTTVRDLGGSGVNVSLRKAINAGYIPGPRILTAEKSLATTGGHADPSNGVKDELKGDPGPKEGVINSIEEAKKAVRQRYKNGADCIKITATGGVLSLAKDGMGPQFTIAEVKAVVDAADDYGFVTAAHAHGKEGMRRAILGGIHTIEHGTFMDEEIMDLMIEKGTYYVPTISAGMFVYEKASTNPMYFPAIIRPKALAIGPLIKETFAKAHKYGVKIAFGTDTGVSPHGDNAKEFEHMVDAGMAPMDAIISATKIASEALRIDDMQGTLSTGKYADIIAVDQNPIEDITSLQQVAFVMKDGVVYKQ